MRNVFLYFSAFIPMYFLIIVKFTFGVISESIRLDTLTICTLVMYSSLIVLGVIGLLWNIFWTGERAEEIIIISKQNLTDQHFLGYFSLFVLFALTFELTQLSMFMVSIVIIILIGIVYVNNRMYYINPCLNILGFNFYEITYVKEGSEQKQSAKMFYKGLFETSDKPCLMKLKNAHFSFIDKSSTKK